MTTPENPTIDPEISETILSASPRLARRDFLKKAAAFGGTALALSQLRLTANAQSTSSSSLQPLISKKSSSTPKTDKKIPTNHPKHGYDSKEGIVARSFPNLVTVDGLSQSQLAQHLELYNGYVKKINDIEGQILEASSESLEKANPTYSPFRELNLEQSYALNGVILHEYYFETLGRPKKQPTETEYLYKIITEEFGSWDNYIIQLTAVAKSMRGWAMTAYNMRDHRVHNYGLDLHNQAVPVNVVPLLVIDVYEHAYMIDFGIKRAAYLETLLHNVNWDLVDERLKVMILHG